MRIQKTASWLRSALQGIPFWVGHRQTLYPHYPLPEAAIVAELCNLIQANLPRDHILRCEVQYSEFLNKKRRLTTLTNRARVDLLVEPNDALKRKGKGQTYLIEVKRAKAGKANIEGDLDRLSEVKIRNPTLRVGLIIVSEKSRPKRFVNKDGSAMKNIQYTKQAMAPFKVRSVVKAAASFLNLNTAHYACFIEVLKNAKK